LECDSIGDLTRNSLGHDRRLDPLSARARPVV